jgi:hypothetical protein
MNYIKIMFRFVLLAGIFFCCSSWGFLAHRVIAQLAVYELPSKMEPFFYENLSYLVKQSIRPDIRRNTDPSENPKHFIDLENYGDSAAWKMPMGWNDAVRRYTMDTLIKNGYVPYEVIIMKDMLTHAMQEKNEDSILFYAADLCHYISDANVPLHTTANYDGQLSNQKGIHALWESEVPEIELSQYHLYTDHEAGYLKKPEEAIWQAIRHAHGLLAEIFENEKTVSAGFTEATKYHVQTRNGKEYKSYSGDFAKAYSQKLNPSINDQLILSANMVADFLYTSWVDAGKPDLTDLTGRTITDSDKQEMNAENKAFKNDQLIKKNMLIAIKNKNDQ